MKGLAIWSQEDRDYAPGYSVPGVRLEGEASSSRFAPEGFSLWVTEARVERGTKITWGSEHGDEAVFVREGQIRVGDRVCPQGGATVVESSVEVEVSIDEPSLLVHFGPHDPNPPTDGLYGPARTEGHTVHVFGPAGVYAAQDGDRDSRWFTESICETCRIMFFYTSRGIPYVSAPHTHTQDEILYLLKGEVSFGSYKLGPGDGIAVDANQRYGFRSGPQGFGFLNYRRDISTHTVASEGVPRIEGGKRFGYTFVNDVR